MKTGPFTLCDLMNLITDAQAKHGSINGNVVIGWLDRRGLCGNAYSFLYIRDSDAATIALEDNDQIIKDAVREYGAAFVLTDFNIDNPHQDKNPITIDELKDFIFNAPCLNFKAPILLYFGIKNTAMYPKQQKIAFHRWEAPSSIECYELATMSIEKYGATLMLLDCGLPTPEEMEEARREEEDE